MLCGDQPSRPQRFALILAVVWDDQRIIISTIRVPIPYSHSLQFGVGCTLLSPAAVWKGEHTATYFPYGTTFISDQKLLRHPLCHVA